MSAVVSLTEPLQDRPAGDPAAARAGTRKSWLRREELLGVDVGSSLIKAVLLTQRHGTICLKQAVIAPTPSGVVTAGELTNAISVANSLRKLCKDHRLRARSIAVAASGEKVYTQFEVLPREFPEGLDGYVQDAMLKVIPYALDGATFDYETAPERKGEQPGVLWVSSSSQQVEWLREAVTLAGKTPAIVDVQACVLANVYSFNYGPDPSEIALLLHAGPRQMTIALMRGSRLLCSRDTTFNRDGSLDNDVEIPALVVDELARRWEFWLEKSSPGSLERIYLSGGAAKSAELREDLRDRTGLPVDELNPFRSISYPSSSEAGKVALENGPTLAVAVGLALRGFENL